MTANRVYYGWTIVSLGFVNLAVAFGVWYSFSVFFIAIFKEFGWSRAATAGVFSVFTLVHALSGLVVGCLLDRFHPRILIPIGSILIAAGLFLTSRTASLVEIYFYYGVITSLGICLIGLIPTSFLTSKWFLAKRGLAMGFASAGIGLGTLIFIPLIQYAVANVGWRITYLLMAISVLILIVPPNTLLQRKNPAEVGLAPDGEIMNTLPPLSSLRDPAEGRTSSLYPASISDVLKARSFWCLFLTFFATPFAVQGVIIHQVAYMLDRGFSAQMGAYIFGLIGLLGSLGKILFGHFSDRLGRSLALTLGLGITSAGIVCLMLSKSEGAALIYFYAILFGLGYGSIAPIFPSRAADLFQGPWFGRIYGVLSFSAGLGAAAGAWFNGRIYDLTQSYQIAFLASLGALSVSIVFFWHTGPRLTVENQRQ
ncbi:MAG: MFS transporter [Thermodesulfobacteriota bacterium]